MEKKDQWNIGYWIVAFMLLLMLQNYWQAAKTVEPVPYAGAAPATAASPANGQPAGDAARAQAQDPGRTTTALG